MKKSFIYLLLPALALMWGCNKKTNYPGGEISPFFSLFDVKNLFHLSKEQGVTLSVQNMDGSSQLAVTVVSDHRAGNLPPGLLIVQERRRLNALRGIAIPLPEAAGFLPGDSLHINVVGAEVKRIDGLLQLTGIGMDDIKKVAANVPIPINRVPANLILKQPDIYESTLVAIVKGTFEPLPQPGDVLSGNKILNDGFGTLVLHTEPSVAFANNPLKVLANYFGIIYTASGPEGTLVPQIRVRKEDDVVELSNVVEITPIVIAGFASDIKGGDGGYEYIQLLATRDINFATTPFSVVVTNNANTATPTGVPGKGWGTGGQRTFKFNLTTGTAAKGTFFYVGGHRKMINGSGSTSIASANWIRAFDYVNQNGDGFGTKTGGLFANSGNASGLAVFPGTTVDAGTKPVDVIFVSSGGSLYSPGPPAQGYRICNTDWYDVKNPITLEDQPFYRAGDNTLSMSYGTADVGYWQMLGGEYNVAIGRWTKARIQNNIEMAKDSPLGFIEGEGATKLK